MHDSRSTSVIFFPHHKTHDPGAQSITIHPQGNDQPRFSLSFSQQKEQQCALALAGSTDFLGLRLVIHGVPLLGLLGRNGPLGLSKLLRLANSRIRHIGCWGRRGFEKNVGRGVVVDGREVVEIGEV